MELLSKLVLTTILTVVFSSVYYWYGKLYQVVDVSRDGSQRGRTIVRGAGVCLLAAVVTHFLFSDVLHKSILILVAGSILITLLGLIDDHKSLRASTKLLVQSIIVLTVFYLFGFPPLVINLGDVAVNLEGLLLLLPILVLIWCVNVHNFLDGVDGIACLETLFVLPMASYFMFDAMNFWAEHLLVVATGTFILLCWNLPPARMFLGDAGATLLGFTIGCTIMIGFYIETSIGIAVLILYGAFLTDGTMTLLVRLIAGENCFRPHQQHLYQLVEKKFGVIKCLQGLVLLNFLWFLPFALLAFFMPAASLLAGLIAFFPAIVGHTVFRYFLVFEITQKNQAGAEAAHLAIARKARFG